MPQREGNTAAALPSMLPSAFVMNYEHSTLHVEHCTLTSRRGQLDYSSTLRAGGEGDCVGGGWRPKHYTSRFTVTSTE